MAALFGWQGLSLRHPDDWAPVALSGDRRSGYVRLASPRDLSLQVRWAPLGREDLERALGRYLDRLSADARRRRRPFEREVFASPDAVRYRYRGEGTGEGLLFPSGDGRVVFIEAVGESTTARRRVVQSAHESFSAGTERWSVLGLDLTLPAPLRVEKKEFLAGRTALTLVGRGVRVVAERWGLAEGLLDRRTLGEWALDRLGRGWSLSEDPVAAGCTRARAGCDEEDEVPILVESPSRGHECIPRLQGRLSRRTLIGFEEAQVRHQPEANQITLLRVRGRDEKWRPDWDWLT